MIANRSYNNYTKIKIDFKGLIVFIFEDNHDTHYLFNSYKNTEKIKNLILLLDALL